jgi:hypothetical protein
MIKEKISFQHVCKLKNILPKKNLLIVGKGPSIENWKECYKNKFNTIGINHASSFFNTNIAHFTDLEMFLDQKIYSEYVILSGMMNVKNETCLSLEELINTNKIAKFLHQSKRLFTYDIITCENKKTNLFGGNIEKYIFKYASGVLIIQIAKTWSLTSVYTIGIDGGNIYHEKFKKNKGNGMFLDKQIDLMQTLAEKMKIIKL